MTNAICLDKNYSTTRLVVQEKPIINHNRADKFETMLWLPKGKHRQGEGGMRLQNNYKKSYPYKPLISIITVVYNGERFLEKTIHSVIRQHYDNVEYIIIDGGSTDGTVDIIKQYENKIDYWLSEHDNGISDAFNKGITCCSGDIIGIINADDYYCSQHILNSIIAKYQKGRHIMHGDLIQMRYKMSSKSEFKPIYKKSSSNAFNDILKCRMGKIYHPTLFVTLATYKSVGLFCIKKKLAMDYDFLIRSLAKNVNFIFVDEYIANMRLGGISDDFLYKAKLEVIASYKKNIAINNYLSIYFWISVQYLFVIKAFIRYTLEKNGFIFLVNIYRKIKGIA